jgi:hypothetical protein
MVAHHHDFTAAKRFQFHRPPLQIAEREVYGVRQSRNGQLLRLSHVNQDEIFTLRQALSEFRRAARCICVVGHYCSV